jgi:hypothetical protein
MDTDGLVLLVETRDFYSDIKENLDYFDTSNYPENNKFNIPKNKSVLGRMKDEFAGQPPVNFYGTGAKAYCINLENKCEKKAKGIKKYVINASISAQDYRDVVENSETKFRKMNIFKSILHKMHTQLKNKVALCPKDDKRYVMPGSFKTLAWFHKHVNLLNDNSTSTDDEINECAQILKNLVYEQYKT